VPFPFFPQPVPRELSFHPSPDPVLQGFLEYAVCCIFCGVSKFSLARTFWFLPVGSIPFGNTPMPNIRSGCHRSLVEFSRHRVLFALGLLSAHVMFIMSVDLSNFPSGLFQLKPRFFFFVSWSALQLNSLYRSPSWVVPFELDRIWPPFSLSLGFFDEIVSPFPIFF